MALHPVVLVRPQHTEGDCAIAALAMLLHVSYEDVLALAAQTLKRPHERGLFLNEIERLTVALGHRLKRVRRGYDIDSDTGILGVRSKAYSHVVVIREGVLIDPVDGEVWFDPSAYIDAIEGTHGPLLRYVEEG